MWFRIFVAAALLSGFGVVAVEPEDRRKIELDPDDAVRQLLPAERGVRVAVLSALGWDFPGASDVEEVRLAAVNLDSDSEIERVLVVRASGQAAVFVLKRIDGEWWDIGSFYCCGPGSRVAEPFVELRRITSPDTYDLVVHSGGKGGTGIGRRNVCVYRVQSGRLYKVLDVVESAYDAAESEHTSTGTRRREA